MAEQFTIQMQATITTAADDIANIDVPQDALLMGVDWLVVSTGSTTAERAVFQMSFISTIQTANDVRGVISNIGWEAGTLVTSGVTGGSSPNKWVSFGDGLILQAGERVYMHQFGSNAPLEVFAVLHLASRVAPRRRSTRRR